MATTAFNPTQRYLLQLFAHSDEEELLEIKKLLTDFHRRKADKELDRLWDLGILNQAKLDEWRGKDIRAVAGLK